METPATELIVRLRDRGAKIPERSTRQSVGYDLTSIQTKRLAPGGWEVLNTGISISLPDGTYGRIAPRSGLAARFGISVGGGVIDPDFTGRVQVILFNHSSNAYVVTAGDRIAQLILEQAAVPPVVVAVEDPEQHSPVSEVPDTKDKTSDQAEGEGPASKRFRGEDGFGSTGP